MSWLGKERVVLESCETTMSEAETLARAGAAHGTVVITKEQTAGRGRRGRSWDSASGTGLAMSIILRPELATVSVPPITLAAGVAVCDAVNSLGAAASLKWPNDVVTGTRKLAGILTEMSTFENRIEHVVVGIGVNVSAVPEGLQAIATSVAEASGTEVSMEELEGALLPELERQFDVFFGQGPSAIIDAVRERIEWGRLASTRASGGLELTGRAIDIDPSGALIIEDAAGARHSVVAGEVTWASERQ